MRVLLDECLPRRLKRELVGHDVKTAPEMGWASKRNGELLGLAVSRFDPPIATCRTNRMFRRSTSLYWCSWHAAIDWTTCVRSARASASRNPPDGKTTCCDGREALGR